MLSAICFNLDQSKILSPGNGLISYDHCNVLLKQIILKYFKNNNQQLKKFHFN